MTHLCRKRLIVMVLLKTNDSDCERRMKDRGRSLRQSRSHKSSTPPATLRRHFDVDVADDKRRRPKASLSPKPDTEKNRNRPRHQARKDWVAEWEKQKSPITVEGSSHEFLGKLSKTSQTTILFRSLGGLLCVRSRSGWTSETLQSQPEEDLFAEAQKTPKKQESRIVSDVPIRGVACDSCDR